MSDRHPPKWQCKRCRLLETSNLSRVCTACLNATESKILPVGVLYIQPRPYTYKPIAADELVLSEEEMERLHQVRLAKEERKKRQSSPKQARNTIKRFRGRVLKSRYMEE